MAPETLHLLLIEDSADDAALMQHVLRQAGIALSMRQVDTAAAMAAALDERQWDIVISDYNLPTFNGTDALRLLRERSAETPFIVLSGLIGEEAAVMLMKAGADDYVMKDNLARLVPAVRRSLKEAQTRAERRQAETALRESEERFKAIAANMPGTVLQLLQSPKGRLSFSYVSEGCQALIGVAPRQLLRNPKLLLDLVDPADSDAFKHAMRTSARTMTDCNWEGRIRVRERSETKWVNLRASPRKLDDGRVLWDGILSNITQNKMAELEIRRSREDLSRLSAHVETIKEEERARIAREVHDDLGGTLTAIKIELMRLTKWLPRDALRAQESLSSTEALLEDALHATRRISTELRPGILDLGILAALEWQAVEFANRMDMPCRVTCVLEDVPLDNKISIALFRLFQEALTNVAKHAAATQVSVELEADEDSVTLLVHDNGCGISPEDVRKPQAFGILGMQERTRSLGGTASLRGTHAGTTVTLRLPRTTQNASEVADDDQSTLYFGTAMESILRPASAGGFALATEDGGP